MYLVPSGGARVISARGQDNVSAPLPGGGGGGVCAVRFRPVQRAGGGGGVLSVFGGFNERVCCPFRPVQRAGGGGGGGGGCCPLTTACGKKFLDKRGGCKLQPPTNPPLHFLESIAFLATNLLCDNDCGYDNYIST